MGKPSGLVLVQIGLRRWDLPARAAKRLEQVADALAWAEGKRG